MWDALLDTRLVLFMSRYVACLEELLGELLKKVQFLHCADWLDTIDMEKYDDDVSGYISEKYFHKWW